MNNTKLMIAAAAMGGLLAGAASHVSASIASSGSQSNLIGSSQAGANGAAKTLDAHSCKGMNSCKGQGGCSTGDGGCKGKNSCKGKGGCKTSSML
jgi:hypothetical protein